MNEDRRIDVVTMATAHTHTQQEPVFNQRRHLGEKRGSRKVWRRLGEGQDNVLEPPSSPCDRPLAQAGVPQPPEPAAGSTHSSAMQNSNSPNAHTTNMEHLPYKDQEHQEQHTSTEEQDSSDRTDKLRKLKVAIPEELLSTLRANCAAKAAVSLLGRIQGKHPGLKTLTAWAKDTLHPSLTLLSLKANNLFEVTFDSEEGRLHALRQADFKCESSAIFFASWQPHFDSRAPQAIAKLDCPVWVQVIDLCQVLREEKFLRTIGEQLGQVIAIDSSDAYKAKLLGPRIRLLVQDPNNLPHSIVIPRLDGDGEIEYELEFSGLPNQCGRCRARDHQVRHCPKNEPERSRKSARTRQRTGKRVRTELSSPRESRPTPPASVTKGECSARSRTAEAADALHQEPANKKDKRERWVVKEKPAPGIGDPGPSKLSTIHAEVTQVDASVESDAQAVPPPPCIAQTFAQIPEEKSNISQIKIVDRGVDIPTSSTSTQQEPASQKDKGERGMAKEKHTSGAGETIPSALHEAPVLVDTSARSDTQAVSQPPSIAQPTPGTPMQEPDEESNYPRNKFVASGGVPPPPLEAETIQEQGSALSFLPDDINFPRLQSPMRHSASPSSGRSEGSISPTPQFQTPQPKERSPNPALVWGPRPTQEEGPRVSETQPDKGRTKAKSSASKTLDSAPITRQGYRTGRLAEDFWTALGLQNIPASPRKTLQAIPFLIKNPQSEQAEYLVDYKVSPPGAITQVHIAELLAGIPWTSTRARNHVVNEISHALQKVLAFNNNLSNPFQQWQQGKWFASWVEEAEGEFTCTIFVCVTVTEQKVKPRKGQNFRWQQVPEEIRAHLIAHEEDNIVAAIERQQWLHMAGKQITNKAPPGYNNTASSNVEDPPSTAVTTAGHHAR